MSNKHNMDDQDIFHRSREAFRSFAGHDQVNSLLKYLSNRVRKNIKKLLAANQMNYDRRRGERFFAPYLG